VVVDATGRQRVVVEGTPSVSVSNFPGTQPVSGSVSVSNFPASQAVTGPLTDAQLRASAVPTSVSNFPASQTVAGTVTANAGTGPWPVTDNGGSLTVDGAVSTTSEGNVAHDAVDTGNPIKVGGKASPGTPAAVASGDRVDAHFDTLGRQGIWIADKGTSLSAAILNSAPGSDTGQSALAVRVISQLGAGSGGGGGGTALVDKTGFTEGTTSLTPIGGVLNETISSDPTEDQAAAARITPKRGLHVNLRNNSGAELGIAAAPVRTDPTGTTTQPVSGSVSVSNFPATQPVSGSVTATGPLTDTQLRASAVPVSNGQLPSALVGGRLDVNIGAANAGIAIPIIGSVPAQSTVTWTSATALNTALTASGVAAYGQANVQIVVPSTVTAGTITIEVTADGSNWSTGGAVRVDNGQLDNDVQLAYRPGTNGNRIYAVSLDSFTAVRARLSSVIVGSGNVVITIAPAQQGIEPFVVQRSRKSATYTAVFKGATRPYQLANTFTANTRKQYATIFHAATATKTVRIRRCTLEYILQTTAAGELALEFVRLTSATTPATGNPTITPTLADSSDSAAEVTCLALPTTAGTEGGIWDSYYTNEGITGAASAASPVAFWNRYEFINQGAGDDEAKFPTIRAGVAEGWAVVIDSVPAGVTWARIIMTFTEEAP
jgi:hypothetical protein